MKEKVREVLKNFPSMHYKVIKNQYPDIYNHISINFEGHKFVIKIFHFMYDTKPHDYICAYCDSQTSFISINKGYGKYCSTKCSVNGNALVIKEKTKQKILDLGYYILSENEVSFNRSIYKLEHPVCHHIFTTNISNLNKRIKTHGIAVPCTICGKKSRQKKMTQRHMNNSRKFRAQVLEQNKITYNEYNDLCRYFTRQKYKNNTETINSDNLELGHAKYHIDHKISIFTGCKNGIHPKIISGHDNLQVIWFKDNIKKGKKVLIEYEKLLQEMIKKNEIEYPDFKKLLKDFMSSKEAK